MSMQIHTHDIVDTHVHIWDLENIEYSWLEGDDTILNRTYLLPELLPEIEMAQVKNIVLVQAANNLEDTQLLLATAAQHEVVSGVVGWLPLMQPEQTARLLEQHRHSNPYFKGVRHLIHNEKNANWLLKPAVVESLQLLAQYKYPFDFVGIHTDHLKTLLKVVAKVPTLKIVLDHLNQPPIAAGQQFGDWGLLLKELSAASQVHAKISGLGTTCQSKNWGINDVFPYIEYVIRLFGSSRCFCGGDWPVSLLAGSYSQHWQVYSAVLEQLLPPSEQQDVLAANAMAFYQLADKTTRQ